MARAKERSVGNARDRAASAPVVFEGGAEDVLADPLFGDYTQWQIEFCQPDSWKGYNVAFAASASPGAQLARWRLDDEVRLLTPFDPVVWDRRRFTIFWDWTYRFEAYTPAFKRKLGYYALPLLWRDRVVGWGNLSVVEGVLRSTLGYVDRDAPRDPAFHAGLEAELARMNSFLGLGGAKNP